MGATDGEPTAADEFQRLTYGQIGDRLGITADAARQLVRRKGWSRSRPNTIGQPVVVDVPADALTDVQLADDRREPTDNGAGLDATDRRSDLAVTLRLAIDMLGQQLERAEQAAVGERSRADALRDQLDELRAERDQARAEAQGARQTADRLRRVEADAAKLEETARRAEEDRAAAVSIADEAVRAAEELRQADAERQARGRWARLCAAWRGSETR